MRNFTNIEKHPSIRVEEVAYEITVAIVGSAAILLTVLVFK